MTELDRLKHDIAEIAGRVRNVTSADIKRVISQLEKIGYEVRSRKTTHSILYVVGGAKFAICEHHKGSRQLKPVYVRAFLDAMVKLELLD
jgi:hypothetical protein